MSATITVTPTKTKSKGKPQTALERAMAVHELQGEFLSPSTTVDIVKEAVEGVPGAYVLKNVCMTCDGAANA